MVDYNVNTAHQTNITYWYSTNAHWAYILKKQEKSVYHTRYIDGRLDDSSFIYVRWFSNVI